eukprot:CAMPEP_0174878858 /NCGR_PEP_ID=MMETSP1114-20130205/82965_1 /TAXON_ID=312471 /ORGANISM="Neobodo designis, Strain CCAP 1951/1" /LENGTH=154 /DNA_ID=CAMNT_0016114247 /DNA_START=97 /DNA_END=562 /DNA_ORIENTATION=-
MINAKRVSGVAAVPAAVRVAAVADGRRGADDTSNAAQIHRATAQQRRLRLDDQRRHREHRRARQRPRPHRGVRVAAVADGRRGADDTSNAAHIHRATAQQRCLRLDIDAVIASIGGLGSAAGPLVPRRLLHHRRERGVGGERGGDGSLPAPSGA